MTVDKIALHRAIVAELARQGIDLPPRNRRHRDAVDLAVVTVEDSLARAHRFAEPSMGAAAWAACDDTDEASRAMLAHYAEVLRREHVQAHAAITSALVRRNLGEPAGDVAALQRAYDEASARREALPKAYAAPSDYPHPRDVASLHRCLGFLAAVPDAARTLPELAERSPEWGRLVAAWPMLDALALTETDEQRAPMTAAALRSLGIEHPRPVLLGSAGPLPWASSTRKDAP